MMKSSDTFSIESAETDESILDQPQADLSPDVWQKTTSGYALTADADEKINAVVKWIAEKLNVSQYNANITGSITSNSFSDRSDVDVHFNSTEISDSESANKLIRQAFADEYPVDRKKIADYPIEVYVQGNPYQDLMSVGCYDILNKTWLTGPELSDVETDPYQTFFDVDMENVKDIIADIRNIVLVGYELATVIVSAKNPDFIQTKSENLLNVLQEGARLFDYVRSVRKKFSAPTSPEEAAKTRSSSAWKVADSSFKLMDKFGYTGMLGAFSSYYNDIVANKISILDAANSIISKIDINKATDNIDEDAKTALTTAVLAGILAIPNVLAAKPLEKNLGSVIKPTSTLNSHEVKKAMSSSLSDNPMIGKMSYLNVLNAVARTLWDEARGEGEDGIKAVATVLMNRAGNDPTKYVDVISRRLQFSGWNNYKGGWTDSTYQYFIPYKMIGDPKHATPANKKIWHYCNQIANELLTKKFVGLKDIGNRNLYMNKKTAGAKAKKEWGHLLDKNVGKHSFGYDRSQDGYRKAKKKA